MDLYATYEMRSEDTYKIVLDDSDWEDYLKTINYTFDKTNNQHLKDAYGYFCDQGFYENGVESVDLDGFIKEVEIDV